MNLLDFARGPGLQVSLVVLIIGVFWRLLGSYLLVRNRDFSKPRETGTVRGGLRTIFSRFWHHKEFVKPTAFHLVAGYVLHIGLLVVVFLFVPHIVFLKGLTGLSWPGLPNDLVLLAGALTIAALVALLIRRLTHPVMRLISNADDYFSWLITLLPLVTGILAYAHLGADYETLLAIHLLSVEALLIWFPFGKL
ncbi:MAG: nitrate reductase, partial [Chromatiales bacterium]|nr:nitrate reductase [Chromatiales bacterium]